jgi:hypothetical protein
MTTVVHLAKVRNRRAAIPGSMMASGALYPRLNKRVCGLKAET